MERDNRGMSIIEVIIILAMMAVLLGFMTNIIGYLSGKQARECAYKLDASLAGIRMDTMSKSTGGNDVFLTLEKRNGQFFVIRNIKGTEKQELVGGEQLTVKAIDAKGNEVEINDSNSITFYFNRETGGLQKDTDWYERIIITQGRVTYEVTIEPVTGKFSYTRI